MWLERRLGWIQNQWKMTQREGRDWNDTFVRWVNKLWNWLLMVELCITYTKRRTLVRTRSLWKYTRLQPQSVSIPLAVVFPVCVSLCQLASVHFFMVSYPPPPLLRPRLLLHFASDKGSGLCADCGWLEHCAVHWRSRNLSPCALNVPLEQQFLWGEIMWWASVRGSEGGAQSGYKGESEREQGQRGELLIIL